MGDVLVFPRVPSRSEPEDNRITEDEHRRYLAILKRGWTEDMALEVLVLRRRSRAAHEVSRGN